MRCSVCGSTITENLHGPYDHERYVCDQCWKNPALYFPDKNFYIGSYRFTSESDSSETKLISPMVQLSKNNVNTILKHRPPKYTLNIAPNKRIEADIVDIPLDELKLDPKNVRFRHLGRSLSKEDMVEFIWKDAASSKLYQQIVFSQGLSEEPIVDSNYFVKEGNMRLVCLLKLKEKILSGDEKTFPISNIDPLRVILLSKDVDESDIAILLTRTHVTGKNEWEALNQASQLYDLYNEYGYSYDKIAESCGMGKSSVVNSIEAYELDLQYHEIHPQDQFWVNRFSYFYELVKKKKVLQDWYNPKNIELFMQWVANEQITRGAEVRLLPQIIKTPGALEAMIGGVTIENTLKILSREDPTVTSKSFKTLQTAIDELQRFPRGELIDTIKNPAKMKVLEALYDELGNLINDIKTVSTK